MCLSHVFKFHLKNVERERRRRQRFGGQDCDGQRVEFSLQLVRQQRSVQRNVAQDLKHTGGTKAEGLAQRGLTCGLQKKNWLYGCTMKELKQTFVDVKEDFPVSKQAGLISADAAPLLLPPSSSEASGRPF